MDTKLGEETITSTLFCESPPPFWLQSMIFFIIRNYLESNFLVCDLFIADI